MYAWFRLFDQFQFMSILTEEKVSSDWKSLVFNFAGQIEFVLLINDTVLVF
jgi:hypothetical protein